MSRRFGREPLPRLGGRIAHATIFVLPGRTAALSAGPSGPHRTCRAHAASLLRSFDPAIHGRDCAPGYKQPMHCRRVPGFHSPCRYQTESQLPVHGLRRHGPMAAPACNTAELFLFVPAVNKGPQYSPEPVLARSCRAPRPSAALPPPRISESASRCRLLSVEITAPLPYTPALL